MVRELSEETGLEGLCGPFIGWAELLIEADADGPAHHSVVLDFEVTVLGDESPVGGDDAAEARWVDLHEVGELQLAPGLAEFLHDHGIIPTFT